MDRRAAGLSGRPHRIQELADLELEAVAVDWTATAPPRAPATMPEPVSLAPRCTSVMLEETCWVPWAACCTLREISCVAAPCSSTAGRNGRGDLRQPFDGAADLLDRVHRLLGRALDAGDLLADLAGGLRGLLGQRLHFRGHDRKAAAGFAGARRLDGGIERQQIGLAGDGVDRVRRRRRCGRPPSTIRRRGRWWCGPGRRPRWPSAPIPAPGG